MNEMYADDMFPEPPPTHPDDLTRSDPTTSRAAFEADSDDADSNDAVPTSPLPTASDDAPEAAPPPPEPDVNAEK
eukprot:6187277-Pleurochrysis_carterae.AAC.1